MKYIAAGAIAAQAALALYIALFGPLTPIPLHFNIAGEVDRWGGRGQAALMVVIFATVSAGVVFGLNALARRQTVHGMVLAQGLTLFVTSMMCSLVAGFTFGPSSGDRAPGLVQFFSCGVVAGIGAYLGKVGPNPIIGVRTPWAFSSRLAWDRSNRLAGRLFFWGGLVGLLAAPFTPQPAGMQATVAFILIGSAVSVFESWRVWRSDPDRTRWS